MKTIEISNQSVISFGVQPGSFGMEVIIFDLSTISPLEVIELPNCYLNPVKEPSRSEIFALRGAVGNMKLFTQHAIEMECIYRYDSVFGITDFHDDAMASARRAKIDENIKSFVPWYEQDMKELQMSDLLIKQEFTVLLRGTYYVVNECTLRNIMLHIAQGKLSKEDVSLIDPDGSLIEFLDNGRLSENISDSSLAINSNFTIEHLQATMTKK